MATATMPEAKARVTAAQRIGAQLQALRKREDVGLKVVAQRAGISVAYLSQIENAQRSVPINVLERVAKAVGCDVVLTRGT